MPDLALTMPQAKRAAELYEDGHSLREVAKHSGRSMTAVRNALLALNVQMRDRAAATADFNRSRAGRKYRKAGSVFSVYESGSRALAKARHTANSLE